MCLVCLVNGAPFSMGRDGGAASAATTSASWGAADCGGMAYNGGAACDGGLAAGSLAWLTTVLRRKPAASRTTAARRIVAAWRGVRPFAVVVTRSFPEIFPQLSDRFNHTNTRASCKKPPTKEHLSQSVIFFCAHQIAIFHLFDRQHRHSPDR